MKKKRTASLSLTGPRQDAAEAALFSLVLFFAMHIWSEPFALGAAFLAFIVCLGRNPWRLAQERFCVPVLGFAVFVLLFGAAAIYSPFGSSAVRDFRGALAAFAVAALVLFRIEKRHVRALLWGLAVICAVVSLLCTSFACEGPLYEIFCSVMDLFGQSYMYRGEIENTIARVNGIYNDANISASILALGTLVSLYLARTGKKWWERLLACALVSASALGILLSVSRGAILCFGISLLVWLAAAGKRERFRLFLLLVIAAGVTLVVSLPAGAAVEPGNPLPNVLAIVSGGAIFLLDWFLGDRLARGVYGRTKAVAAAVGAVAVCIVVFAVAALNLKGAYVFGEGDNLYRALPLEPGAYTLFVEWEGDENCRVVIYSRSEQQALTNSQTELYDGYEDQITFEVPDDAVRVFFRFRAPEGNIIHSATLSDGTEIPLSYRLLPEMIVRRLQENPFEDNSFLMRLQFDKDAWKIFTQSPLFGHGLGSTDNLYPAVQPFYYTSRYVHNHILQIMADMGLLGLAAFLAFLGGVLCLLIGQLRKERDMLAAVLLACWVMINTHSLMEVNFSVQAYQCAAFVLLLLPAALYGRPLSESAAKAGGAAVCAGFLTYLALFGGLMGMRQTVWREYTTRYASNIDEAISWLADYAKRDVFEPERYEVEYVAATAQDTSGQYGEKMLNFVEKIRNSGNYPSCSALPEIYYLRVEDFEGLFECSRVCLLQRASYATVWNEQAAFYRERVLPAAGVENIDVFLEGVLAFYDLLEETNQRLTQDISLTGVNQAFVELALSAREQNLSGEALYDYLISGN